MNIRSPVASLLVIIAAASTSPSAAAAEGGRKHELRIGYQKYGTLVLLKARGALEKRLAPLGVEVRWTEFPAGPALLEAIHAGAIDLGQVGEAPPVFARAAGADLVYVATEPPEPAGEAVVVRKDSPLRSVAELKGKRIALNKGSNVHYLLVKLLEKAGLAYGDVETVFLAPADARAAFERGSVDAWVIWDPFLAAAQRQIGVRILADGQGVVSNRPYYLASRELAEGERDLVAALLEELDATAAWARAHPEEVSRALAPALGLDPATVSLSLARKGWGVQPVTDGVLAEEQRIADVFAALKLIPAPIDVRQAVPRSPARSASAGR